MVGRRTLLLALLLSGALCLGFAATAFADAFTQVYKAYRNTAKVDPCKFSEQTLKQAQQEVPPDIDQYAPDFPAAIAAALQARAAGACAPKSGAPAASAPSVAPPASGSGGGGTPSASAPASSSATPAPPAGSGALLPVSIRNARSTTDSGAPAPVVAIAVLALLLLLLGALLSWTRWRGREARWMLGAQHALAEAGYRAETTWAEFVDWLRLGR